MAGSTPQLTFDGYVASVRANTTNSGRSVTSVTMAWAPQKKTDQGWENTGPTTWFEATLWGPAAEQAASIEKGDRVVMTGTPTIESYETRQGGQGVKIAVLYASVALRETKRDRDERRNGTQGGFSQANSAGQGSWATASTGGAENGAQGAAAWNSGASYDEPAPF